jgi:ketosteroid isomerase-like protein
MTRRLFFFWLAVPLLLAPRGLMAQTAQAGAAEKAVREVLRQMIDADLKDDAAELDRTLAEDYVIIRDNGVVRSRAETLDGIRTHATKFEAFKLSDVQVRLYGDTAVVTFHADIKGSRAGKDMSGAFRETRVFVKRDEAKRDGASRGGAWRAVLAQRTRITGS